MTKLSKVGKRKIRPSHTNHKEMNSELERLNARRQLIEAVRNYCQVFFKEDDEEWIERFVAGVQAFLQVNYYQDPYIPVVGVEDLRDEKKWWQFWK